MVNFINDFSRYVSVFLVKEKFEILAKVEEFKKEIEGKIRMKIQCLHSNNRGEYTSKDLCDYLCKNRV